MQTYYQVGFGYLSFSSADQVPMQSVPSFWQRTAIHIRVNPCQLDRYHYFRYLYFPFI
jgi:hypothetical protein